MLVGVFYASLVRGGALLDILLVKCMSSFTLSRDIDPEYLA